ncbi:hypothetical protein CHS0354_018372 [Potamilus streckersoni]|uniref:4Fe-4S ferredoxin-type domain-containing protein n=1 Tax=Potamilus streckersoni TaxID=2493646 RepID=A0AAE0W986_9BIVA|nr:hypothetical protein CHS0354_018372 [Potamilus streckersoni]
MSTEADPDKKFPENEPYTDEIRTDKQQPAANIDNITQPSSDAPEKPFKKIPAPSKTEAGDEPKPYFPFYRKRHIFFVFAALIGLGFPFLTIDGNRLFMMSFLHERLELFGMVFDTSHLYVLPFMIFSFACLVLLVTALGGRIWCGWACPQTMFRTVYRDLIQGFILRLRSRNNKNTPLKLKTASQKIRFGLGILIWSLCAFLGAADLLWYFINPSEFFEIITVNPGDYPFLISFWIGLSVFFIIDITYIGENFCKYVCPYARIQSVFFDRHTALVMYDAKRGNNTDGSRGSKNFAGQRDASGDCTACIKCVQVCPTGIDIRNGLQLGCIECLECVDACQPIMARKNKPNLISWTTESAARGEKSGFIRPRTIIYASLIVLFGSLIIFLSGNQSYTGLNINRSTQLYQIKTEAGRIENYYILLISNQDRQEHEYQVEIADNTHGIVLERPTEPIRVLAGGKVKKVMTLSAPYSTGGQIRETNASPFA